MYVFRHWMRLRIDQLTFSAYTQRGRRVIFFVSFSIWIPRFAESEDPEEKKTILVFFLVLFSQQLE